MHDDTTPEPAPDGTAVLPAEFAATDPEFAAFITRFAGSEVQAHSQLTDHDRFLVQLGATIAVGGHTVFRLVLDQALDAGVSPVVVKDIVYQATAYVGLTGTADSLRIVNEALTARGVTLPLPGQATTTPETRLEEGTEKQREIVGTERLTAMHQQAPDDAVHFQRFLSGNCFGDYHTRAGLTTQQRELLTFAILVGLGGADNQVAGHVAANLHVGNTRQDLLDVLTVLVPYVGYPRTLNGPGAVNAGAPAN